MGAAIKDWAPHLGRKVSIRFRLHDGDHPFSEAIGVVSAVEARESGQSITILTRRGRSQKVADRDIVAAKIFPS